MESQRKNSIRASHHLHPHSEPQYPPSWALCSQAPQADSQGPQLGHVVEAGHGDGGDVVVVQGPKWGGGEPRSLSIGPAGSCAGRGGPGFPLTLRSQQEAAREGGGPGFSLTLRSRFTLKGPALGWTPGGYAREPPEVFPEENPELGQ